MKRTQKTSGSKFSSPHGREDIDAPQDPNKPNTAKKGPRPLTRDDPDVAFGFAGDGDGDGVTPQPFFAHPPAAPSAEAQPTASSPFARAAPASAPETAASTLAPPAPAEPRAEPEQKTEADKKKATYDEAVASLRKCGFHPAARMAPPKPQSTVGLERPDGNVDNGDDCSFEEGSDVMSDEGNSPGASSPLTRRWLEFNRELQSEKDELDVAADRATEACAKAENNLPPYVGPPFFSKRASAQPPVELVDYRTQCALALAPYENALGELEGKREGFPAVVKQRRTNWAREHGLGLSSELAAGLRGFHGPWHAAFQAERDAALRLVKHRGVITRQVLGGGDWVGPFTAHWCGEPPGATYFDCEDSETIHSLQLGVYAFGCPRCEKWWLRPMAPVIARFDGKNQLRTSCRTCVAQEGDAFELRGQRGFLQLNVNRRNFGFPVQETKVRNDQGRREILHCRVRFA